MSKEQKVIVFLLIAIILLVSLLVIILNTSYEITVNGITIKQKIIWYLLGLD